MGQGLRRRTFIKPISHDTAKPFPRGLQRKSQKRLQRPLLLSGHLLFIPGAKCRRLGKHPPVMILHLRLSPCPRSHVLHASRPGCPQGIAAVLPVLIQRFLHTGNGPEAGRGQGDPPVMHKAPFRRRFHQPDQSPVHHNSSSCHRILRQDLGKCLSVRITALILKKAGCDHAQMPVRHHHIRMNQYGMSGPQGPFKLPHPPKQRPDLVVFPHIILVAQQHIIPVGLT